MALGLVLIMVLQVTMVHLTPVADRLQRDAEVAYATASIGASGDTTLNLSEGAQGSLGSESTLTIGQVGPALLNFSLSNVASNQIITEATLELSCNATDGDASTADEEWIGAQAFLKPWAESGANATRSGTGTNWTGNIIDMEAFFERFAHVTSGSFQRVELDVTYLAQRALAEGTGHVNLLLETGRSGESVVTCASKEATSASERPSLELTYVTGAYTLPDPPTFGAENGTAILLPQFLAEADLTPSLTFSGDNMTALEVQFDGFWASSPRFRSPNMATHDRWFDNASNTSAFTTSTGSIILDVPSSTGLSNGSITMYRARSIDANAQRSTWSYGMFMLPNYTSTLNPDGTATTVLRHGVPGGWNVSGMTNLTQANESDGSELNFLQPSIGADSGSEYQVLIEVDSHALGLPSNIDVIGAEMSIQQDGFGFDPSWNHSNSSTWISMHEPVGTSVSTHADLGPAQAWAWSNESLWLDLNISHAVNGAHAQDRTAALYLLGSGPDDSIGSGAVSVPYLPTFSSGDAYLNLTYTSATVIAPPALGNLTPSSNHPAWDVASNGSVRGDTTPTFTFDALAEDAQMHVANDRLMRDLVQGGDLAAGDTEWNVTGAGLDLGSTPHHSVLLRSTTGGLRFQSDTFHIPALNSTDLGDGVHELRLRHGNSSSDPVAPVCSDTYLASGDGTSYGSESEINVGDFGSSTAIVLYGCDFGAIRLPSEVAVTSAQLAMKTSFSPSASMDVGAFRLNADWSESDANWTHATATTTWAVPGASGSDRGSMMSLTGVTTASGWYGWNVTVEAQDAMRTEASFDVLLDIVGGSGYRDALFYSKEASNPLNQPELVLRFTSGSNALPDVLQPLAPANGSWAVTSGIHVAPEPRPVLNWSVPTAVPIAGWEVQLDTSDGFDSSDLLTVTSFNSNGFDVQNGSYVPTSDLDLGHVWSWRTRAITETFQIGAWSEVQHFRLPDLTSYALTGNRSSMIYEDAVALPGLGVPDFLDATVRVDGSGYDTSDSSSSVLQVGDTSAGHSIALVRIPFGTLPMPDHAHVENATLNLYASPSSPIAGVQRISVHATDVTWTASANGSTYDGTNAWTDRLGDESADLDPHLSDVLPSARGDWMTFDVSILIQRAIEQGSDALSLALIGDVGAAAVQFTSTEGPVSERPWLNITWSGDAAEMAPDSPLERTPANGTISWSADDLRIRSIDQPTLGWNHSDVTNRDAFDWVIHILNDASDWREGWTTVRSTDGLGWTNGSDGTFAWTSATALPLGSHAWTPVAVHEDIMGDGFTIASASHVLHVPDTISGWTNSTDAWIQVRQGGALQLLDEPNRVLDTSIAEVATGRANASILTSTLTSACESQHVAFEFDVTPWSGQPVHEVMNATLMFEEASGSAVGSQFALVMLSDDFDGTANLSRPMAGGTWTDPVTISSSISGGPGTVHVLDVSSVAQHATSSGDGHVRLGLSVLVPRDDPCTSEVIRIHSSEASSLEDRPMLNLTVRNGTSWTPPAPTLIQPNDVVLWNQSGPGLPTPVETVILQASGWPTNLTRAEVRLSNASDFWNGSGHETWTWDSDTNASAFDLTSGTFTVPSSFEFALENGTAVEYHWQMRSIVDHRIGAWSTAAGFCVPDAHGTDDGTANYTVILREGSICEGHPEYLDGTLTNGTTAVDNGVDSTMDLGADRSGSGQADGFIAFDLGDYRFPDAMTPTSAILRVYREDIIGSGSLTAAIVACPSAISEDATWTSVAGSCSTTEVTRTTLQALPEVGWQEWDITSLAQSVVAAGDSELNLRIIPIGAPSSTHVLRTSEASVDWRPNLVLEYVDNVDGVLPPAQPQLVGPDDGGVLYNRTQLLLSGDGTPTLSWSPVVDASGYILSISNPEGITRYRSWESSGFSGTSFTVPPGDALDDGTVHQWWVQAVNGSIPGPASARWTFGIGAPVGNVANSAGFATYTFQSGNEIPELEHTDVQDATLASTNPNVATGNLPTISVGASATSTSAWRTVIGTDLGSVDFASSWHVHSASLGLILDEIDVSGGATTMDVSVHPLLVPFSENQATWSSASWSGAGLVAGVDYDATPIDVVTITTSSAAGSRVWFDLARAGMALDAVHGWVLVGSPSVGSMEVVFHSSEAQSSLRPQMLVNYTEVDRTVLSASGWTGTPTPTADDVVAFVATTLDDSGSSVPVPVTWEVTNGTIDDQGRFDAGSAGTTTVTACYGVICDAMTFVVTPGAPVTLIVATDDTSITSDGTLAVEAYVVDADGNVVPGQSLAYGVTNGSMIGSTFHPVAIGNWTITVSWNGQADYIAVEVTKGLPAELRLSGCDIAIAAATTCTVGITAHDAQGNQIPLGDVGSLTWSIDGGAGSFDDTTLTYTASLVGDWVLSVSSTSGVSAQRTITTLHGAIASLIIEPSTTDTPADGQVHLNTTRVDVEGNRKSIILQESQWTIPEDGSVLEIGSPAIWSPRTKGQKLITGTFEGVSSTVEISVTDGALVDLILEATDSTEVTADDRVVVRARAADVYGNLRPVVVTWTLVEDPLNANQWMDSTSGNLVVLDLTEAGTWTVRAVHLDDDGTSTSRSVTINVTHGDLTDVRFLSPQGVLNLTADSEATFSAQLSDQHGNALPDERLNWTLVDRDTDARFDVTDELRERVGLFDAGPVGNFTMTAWGISDDGYNISIAYDFTVTPGRAVSLDHVTTHEQITAGNIARFTITGTDADGNLFPQDVTWANASGITSEGRGVYTYYARSSGNQSLAYDLAGTSGGVVNLTVDAAGLASLVASMDAQLVEQQDSVLISVEAFDEFGNPIPVPIAAVVSVVPEGTLVRSSSSVWEFTTIQSGEHTFSVNVGPIYAEELSLEVDSTIAGTLAAAGPLAYIGLGLGVIAFIALLVLGVIILRRGDDVWDDYDDEDDEDGSPVAAGPSGPPSGPSGPPPAQVEDAAALLLGTTPSPAPGPTAPPPSGPTAPPPEPEPTPEPATGGLDESWMKDHRVDESGVAWAESHDGIWYYLDAGTGEWTEWTD